MTTSEIATVLAWHDALNAQDVDTLIELSTGDIEIADAHSAAQGHEALREWVSSSGFTAEPQRMYVHDGIVVVEQLTGEQTVASAFRVVHDKVTSVFQHRDLASALAATELTEADLVDA
jgi:SnoaL-like domain